MKSKKKVWMVVALCAVFAISMVLALSFLLKSPSNVRVVLFYPIDGKTETCTLKEGQSLPENLQARSYDGYEFVGWFYDNNLSMPLGKNATFGTDQTLVAGYVKIVEKFSNTNIEENSKFLKIITTNNAKLTAEELKNLAKSKTTYLDLAECEFESDTLEKSIFSSSFIETLVLPKNIVTIGEGAFGGCLGLKKITIGQSVKNIEDSAFAGCSLLREINLPATLETLGKNVFVSCKVSNLELGKNVKVLSAQTFADSEVESVLIDSENPNFALENGAIYTKDKTKLVCALKNASKDFVLNDSVQEICPYAFYGSNVQSVQIGKNIQKIGAFAFKNVKTLQKISVKDATEYIIDNGAFENCTNLESLEFGLGLSEIGDYAFEGVNKPQEIVFHSSTASDVKNLEKIGVGAFKNCTSLKRMTLPDSVVSLCEEAFYNCYNLESINLSARLSEIGEKTFYNNRSLTTISAHGKIESIGAFAFELCQKLKNIECLYDATQIGVGAFKNCKAIEEAVFDAAQNIPAEAFSGCESLYVASFDAAASLGQNAFYGCKNLRSFTLSNNMSSFDESAFYDSGLELIDVKDNTNFYCDRETGVLYNNQKNAIICYPIAKKAKKFTIKEQILNISSLTFFQNPYLEDIDVEPGNPAFFSSAGILFNSEQTEVIKYPKSSTTSAVTLGSNIKKIGKYAFANNQNITLLSLPSSLEEIEASALYNMENLATLYIPFVGENKTSNRFLGYIFGAEDFYQNEQFIPKSLKSVYVTNDTSVEANSFYGASSLVFAQFNKQVRVIKEYAFCNATSLKSIVFEGIVSEIGEYGLYNLSSLLSLRIGFDSELVIESSGIGGEISRDAVISVHNSNQLVSKTDRKNLEDKFIKVCPTLSKVYNWKWKYED